MKSKNNTVFIVYSKAQHSAVFYQELTINMGATIKDALDAVDFYTKYPEAKGAPIGIYAKRVTLNYELKPYDRIEIYRELTCDPKQARKQRKDDAE